MIEVGVNVPNASVMVIESAERFGCRSYISYEAVGRARNIVLYLIHRINYQKKAQRMETMVRTNDGFEIAEVDLQLRGPGDIEGTRQSGLMNFKIADIIKDQKL